MIEMIKLKQVQVVFVFILLLVFSTPLFAIDCTPNPGEARSDLCDFVEQTSSRLDTSFNTVFGGVVGQNACLPPNTTPGAPSPFLNSSNAEWMLNAALVMFISALVFVLVHFLGIALQSPNLIARAKQEYFEFTMTLIRIAFLAVVMLAVSQWHDVNARGSTDVVYRNSPTYIDSAMNFSLFLIKDMSQNFSLLLIYNMVIHTLYSATLWFGITWRAMFSFNLGPALRPIIDIIGFCMQFLTVGIGEWIIHFGMLCLIKKWTWALFMPIAIIMRSVWFLRGAGDALLALIFSLALVYPIMFVIDYEVYKLMGGNVFGTTVEGLGGPYENDSPFLQFVHKFGITGVSGVFIAIGLLMSGFLIPFLLTGALTVAFELIRASVFFIVIMSIVLPFINIFVTLTSAKETAHFFSVDINFMAFVKLI